MLTMASKEEILRLGNENFQPFPAWIEMNPRYARSAYALNNLIRPVAVELCDSQDACEPEMYTNHGNFRLDGYGKSWRMWYAAGRERPDGKLAWERFSWDSSD